MCQIVTEEVVSLTCQHTTIRETVQECGSPRLCCQHPRHFICSRCWKRPYIGQRGEERRRRDMRRSSVARTRVVASPCPNPACTPPSAPLSSSRLKRLILQLANRPKSSS
ncbi:hypothetical protein PsYK624_064320 [Phanerochaete sordida]|uniref:Uncharacterized protein n=1 Tax=Phanerochaete sordida TaxID=48140 RepID=A0A9P3G6R1_9APHY|nr:hypothetical protein PsYK624_064320 [Phanerochaete sordida]